LNLITCLFFGRYVGKSGLIYLVTFYYSVINILTLLLNYQTLYNNKVFLIAIGTWLNFDIITIDWMLMFDTLTSIMLLIVSVVSTIVHYYSLEYMKNDPHIIRFIGYLSLFTFMMFILVTSANFIQLFLGWEGVGLSSYLLINFWFTRLDANKAAIKALLMNRFSDCFLLAAIIAIIYITGDGNFLTIDALFRNINESWRLLELNNDTFHLNCIIIGLIVGAMGKSAQIGLHTWLPSAMEGPSPVSALIHAATMVTAGIFLLIRCSPILNVVAINGTTFYFIGLASILIAATMAIVNRDIKKIIAYSTCSQLGYMFIVVGTGFVNLSLFHLITHAFFKAALFLTAGLIVHQFSNRQSLFEISNLMIASPLAFYSLCISNFAICGFITLSGYYSKDLILEIFFSYSWLSQLFYFLLTLCGLFTVVYSFNLLYNYFFISTRTQKLFLINIVRNTKLMFISLCFLNILTIFIGFFSYEIFAANTQLQNSIITNLSAEILNSLKIYGSVWYPIDILSTITIFFQSFPFEFTITNKILFKQIIAGGGYYKVFYNIIILPTLLSIYLIWELYLQTFKNSIIFTYKNNTGLYLQNLWGFDNLYNKLSKLNLTYSLNLYKLIDKGLIEFLGPLFGNKVSYKISNFIRYFHTGNFSLNMLFIIFSIIMILLFVCLPLK